MTTVLVCVVTGISLFTLLAAFIAQLVVNKKLASEFATHARDSERARDTHLAVMQAMVAGGATPDLAHHAIQTAATDKRADLSGLSVKELLDRTMPTPNDDTPEMPGITQTSTPHSFLRPPGTPIEPEADEEGDDE